MTVATVTVNARLADFLQSAKAGSFLATPVSWDGTAWVRVPVIKDLNGNKLLAGSDTQAKFAAGVATLALLATDTADTDPTGFSWRLQVIAQGRELVDVVVPLASGSGPVELVDLADVDPIYTEATYTGRLGAHLQDTTAAHAASAISFTPTDTVAATDVQGAIADLELRTETARGRWPVVAIVTDGAAPIVDTETYVNGDYTITDTDGGVIHSGGLRVRGRGNTTWALPKKPYRLNLDTSTSLLGMTATQKNWALLANHLDNAKVNNSLALTLGRQLSGLTWTPEYRIVEVVLNGDFLGIYQLADLVRLETGRLPGEAANADTGSGLSGVYLLEVTNKESPSEIGEDAEPGWTTSRGNWIIYDTPDAPTTAQQTYIQGYVNDFEAALFGAGFIDPVTGWRAYADESSFVDWYIVNELLWGADSALWSSCKLWKARDGKLHMGPLWDYDLAVGINIAGDVGPTGYKTRSSNWFTRLFQDSTFQAAVAARWPAVVTALGDYPEFIDRLTDSETHAIARDDIRWTQVTYPPLQADKRKRWVADRLAWLGPQLNADPDPFPSTFTPTF